MLNTRYASEVLPPVEIDDCRIELIFVKHLKQKELRFSWWPNGKFKPRPLDLPEADFLELLFKACEAGLISDKGQGKLMEFLQKRLPHS